MTCLITQNLKLNKRMIELLTSLEFSIEHQSKAKNYYNNAKRKKWSIKSAKCLFSHKRSGDYSETYNFCNSSPKIRTKSIHTCFLLFFLPVRISDITKNIIPTRTVAGTPKNKIPNIFSITFLNLMFESNTSFRFLQAILQKLKGVYDFFASFEETKRRMDEEDAETLEKFKNNNQSKTL